MSYQSDHTVRKLVAEQISVAVDDWYESQDRHVSRRLGSSAIGDKCPRKIWYQFRWAKESNFDAQSLRRFETGHVEEIRVHNYLTSVGVTYHPADPMRPKKQHTGTAVNDHAVTKVDGIILLPPEYQVNEWVLLEVKTAQSKDFNKIQKKGVQSEMPKYWDQVCYSGEMLNMNYVLFVVACKNSQQTHFEFLKLDREHGKFLISKATEIIVARTPPNRIADTSTFHVCKMCNFQDICHNGETVVKNCRSCVNSAAGEKGTWNCLKWNCVIPEDKIVEGCDHHQGLHTL